MSYKSGNAPYLFWWRLRVRGVTFYWYQSYGLADSMTTIAYMSLAIHAIFMNYDSVMNPDNENVLLYSKWIPNEL